MKIAVPHDNGNVFGHFGKTEEFKIYDVQDGGMFSSQTVSVGGSAHEALAAFLAGLHVDVLICGGAGAGARNALAAQGIEVYGGVTGSADEAVTAFLSGTLDFDPQAGCTGHDACHT
ncbi:MAG: dinitrogenase iron-molybdenum cofactor biosynthesis protein [Ruminococcus sp.]|nr:dinitrogenase iron-molybdenum cofactor biosynthesis protein [Ruminococcus sp.]